MKTLNVKSPIGTDFIIDLNENTLTVPSKGICEKIIGWATINHDGKLCKAVTVSGHKNIVIASEHYKEIVESINELDREKFAAHRAAVYDAIPGLAILEAAIADEDAYLESFNTMMEDEQNDGVNPPKLPKQNINELCAQYPRAALYLKSKAYSRAANDLKATAGDKAIAILINGGSESEASTILENWLEGVFID